MNTHDLRQTVTAISKLITDANMMLSELEFVLHDKEIAEEEAIEAQGEAFISHEQECDGVGDNGDACTHPDHRTGADEPHN